MEAEVSREKICIQKIVCEKKELIFIEEDMIVPDSKPDILSTINTTGKVCIYKKEVTDGKVKIEGTLNTYIMYLPDSENEHLRSLTANLNFSKTLQVAESKEGMEAITDINIKDLECKVLNGRKINLKAGLEINLKLCSNEDVEIINKIDNIEEIQTLEENLQMNSLIGNNSTRVYVKDTLSIDPLDEILEILKCDIDLVDSDIKISYNKVLAKCEAQVKIMYLTQDGKIGTVEGRIPAVGFIDMQNVSEDNICDVKTEIKNILVKPNPPEEHSIYVELELESSCIAFEKKEVRIIKDLYSPMQYLGFSQKRITTTSDIMSNAKDFTITSKTNISDLSDGNLIDVEVTAVINKQGITNSKIIYEGELYLNFIFDIGNGNINSKVSKIPFETSIDNPFMSEDIKVDSMCKVSDKKFDVKPNGDVDCNIDMEIQNKITRDTSLDIIDNIEFQENSKSADDYDSLILYVVNPGDTLWKIAKKFSSTVEDIAITNGIEDEEKIYPGQKLYIPKFNYSNVVSV